MNSIFKSQKANAVLDLIIVIALLFVIAVSWLTVGYVQKELNDEVQADPTLDAESKALHQEFTTKYPLIFDKAILFFLILFWGMSIVSSLLVDTHPGFFIFSVILLTLYLAVTVILSNAFYEIFTEDLTGLSGDYPFTFFIFNHLLEIAIVAGFTIILALFAKPR